jgi:3',5'-cyclic-AMP phosphodiesterase
MVSTMRPVRLLHVTDPHLFADPSRKIYDVNTAQSLDSVLREALRGGAPAPDAILATGDIGDDMSPGAYRAFRAAIGGLGIPVLCLPGNHDAPALMADLLGSDGFQFCGRSTLGGWGLVLLDTHVDDDPAGFLAATELARLEADLRAFSDRPVLVCLHHLPVPTGSEWLDRYGLRNAAELLSLLERFPQVKVLLAGHVHQAFDRQYGTVRILATPSTCAQFTPGTRTCVMDLRPPGYRWLSLMPDGTIRTEVVWVQDWIMTARPRDDRI